MTEPRKPRPKQAAWFRAMEASSIGIEMAVSIAAGAIGGYYLERHVTHWSPWTSLLGIAFGVASATYAVVRLARKTQRLAEFDREAHDRSRPE